MVIDLDRYVITNRRGTSFWNGDNASSFHLAEHYTRLVDAEAELEEIQRYQEPIKESELARMGDYARKQAIEQHRKFRTLDRIMKITLVKVVTPNVKP